jgi:aspartyl-tRNA(Asn)/glutamyl-tRNA(Gln) amidotransferase subunit C
LRLNDISKKLAGLSISGGDASDAGNSASDLRHSADCNPLVSWKIMSVDHATVRKIASLARIAASEAEIEAMVPELNNIIGWIEQLGEVDTAAVQPMTAVIANTLRLRDDVVSDGNMRDAILANAPAAEHGFFGVPKVIE